MGLGKTGLTPKKVKIGGDALVGVSEESIFSSVRKGGNGTAAKIVCSLSCRLAIRPEVEIGLATKLEKVAQESFRKNRNSFAANK